MATSRAVRCTYRRFDPRNNWKGKRHDHMAMVLGDLLNRSRAFHTVSHVGCMDYSRQERNAVWRKVFDGSLLDLYNPDLAAGPRIRGAG